MKRCRWEECKRMGPYAEHDRGGWPWTYLCKLHHDQLEMVLGTGNPKMIISIWIKAQGGAKKAAERFMRR